MYLFFIYFSLEDDFLEFSYVVKVPRHVLLDHIKSNRKYKYHVESPLTQQGVIKSLEFIVGVNNAKGALIDRYLQLHIELNSIKNQCKLMFLCLFFANLMFLCMYILAIIYILE